MFDKQTLWADLIGKFCGVTREVARQCAVGRHNGFDRNEVDSKQTTDDLERPPHVSL